MFHGTQVISGGFEHDPVMIPQLSRRLVKEIYEETYGLAVGVGLQRDRPDTVFDELLLQGYLVIFPGIG